jgi:oxygen-independent coproporphyrinogen-3 oxidase
VGQEKHIDAYLVKIIRNLSRFKNTKMDSIYIGGGTPNSLSDEQLINLLTPLTKLCSSKTEFTIECNPESVTVQQAKIFKKFKVNRVSLGAQTTNNILLKEYGRHHTIEDVKKSLNIFKTNGNPNISLDFIYGFNDLSVKDIKNAIEFIKKNKINHVSFYSLEIKQGSILNSNKYKINETKIENQLKTIINLMQSLKFNRYEVSS